MYLSLVIDKLYIIKQKILFLILTFVNIIISCCLMKYIVLACNIVFIDLHYYLVNLILFLLFSNVHRFYKQAIYYLREYRFDGIDLDWEFPKANEKEKYSRFLKVRTFNRIALCISLICPLPLLYITYSL